MPMSRNTGPINIKSISAWSWYLMLSSVYYTNGVGGVAEQFRLQNPTMRVKPKKSLLWELVLHSYKFKYYFGQWLLFLQYPTNNRTGPTYPSLARNIENLGVNHGGCRIFHPTITHIWVTPKLRASTSSPHCGQSSLRLVWVLLRYQLQYLCTYNIGFIVTFLTHAPVTWNAGVNRLTAIRVLARSKNSRPVGFLL